MPGMRIIFCAISTMKWSTIQQAGVILPLVVLIDPAAYNMENKKYKKEFAVALKHARMASG